MRHEINISALFYLSPLLSLSFFPSFFGCLHLSLSIFLSLSPLSLSLPRSLSAISLSIYLYRYMIIYITICVYVYICMCIYIYIYIIIILTVFLYLSLCFCLCLWLSLSLCLSLDPRPSISFSPLSSFPSPHISLCGCFRWGNTRSYPQLCWNRLGIILKTLFLNFSAIFIYQSSRFGLFNDL